MSDLETQRESIKAGDLVGGHGDGEPLGIVERATEDFVYVDGRRHQIGRVFWLPSPEQVQSKMAAFRAVKQRRGGR